MEPGGFDNAAGVALLLGMPTAVLFAAAAVRRSGAPRWAWGVFTLGIVGVLVLLDRAGDVRYPGPVDPPIGTWDSGQFLGLAFGRIGVALNGAACAAVGVFRAPRPRRHPLSRTEGRVLATAYSALAAGAALPAVWWGTGAGLPSLAVTLPVVGLGTALFAATLVLRWRRLGSVIEDDRRTVVSFWPADAVVAVVVTVLVVAANGALGSGLPDPRLVPDDRPTAVRTPEPEWPGPTPAETTTLGADAVRSGTRAALEDTVRWAGPLDDLTSPTPAPASPPAVTLVEERCDGGVRWTGSLVLPSVRPQDVADRVQRGWERSGYAVVDVAMGTERIMPLRGSSPVHVMRLGGGTDGVHVAVESFCVPR